MPFYVIFYAIIELWEKAASDQNRTEEIVYLDS